MNFIFEVFLFFVGCIIFAAYASLFERKLIAKVQLRKGPDKCGIFGCCQPIADALKLFFKKEALKGHSKQSIFFVCLMFAVALSQLSLIPIGRDFCLLSSKYSLIFILIFHTIFALCEVAIGTLSKSKYGILGGTRGFVQFVCSHIPFVLILTDIALFSKSFDINEIALESKLFNNFCLTFPLFVALFINILMFSNKIPFDFVEAESEIVAGSYIEYGGILFAMIYLSDYLNLIFASAFLSTIFFGGCYGIFESFAFINIIIKTVVFIGLIILIRSILPRYKQEQMVNIAWMILSTIALFYLFFLI